VLLTLFPSSSVLATLPPLCWPPSIVLLTLFPSSSVLVTLNYVAHFPSLLIFAGFLHLVRNLNTLFPSFLFAVCTPDRCWDSTDYGMCLRVCVGTKKKHTHTHAHTHTHTQTHRCLFPQYRTVIDSALQCALMYNVRGGCTCNYRCTICDCARIFVCVLECVCCVCVCMRVHVCVQF